MLVSNLPYFMVQWDYKGEQGYGHVIEGMDDAAGRGEGEDGMGGPVDEGEKGGGEFPKSVSFAPFFYSSLIICPTRNEIYNEGVRNGQMLMYCLVKIGISRRKLLGIY